MKTKENKKRQILSDEELEKVTGGLVQIINPTTYECKNIKNEKDCLASKDRCCWAFGMCMTTD